VLPVAVLGNIAVPNNIIYTFNFPAFRSAELHSNKEVLA